MDLRGKSKKVDDDGEKTPSRGTKDESSIASRIAASASGLARNLVTRPGGSEASNTLASTSAASAKPQNQSSAGPSTWHEALPSRTASTSSGLQSEMETFRTDVGSHFQSPSRSSSSEFQDFSRGTQASLIPEPSGFEGSSWEWEFQRPSLSSESAPVNLRGPSSYDDGAEVRALLSDHTFQIDADISDTAVQDQIGDNAADLFAQNFTEEEKKAAEKIKASLPPPPVHCGIAADNPLNLRPEFATLATREPHLREEITKLTSTLTVDEDQVLCGSPSQREHWLAEWDDVLNSYTDEVWGDMLPAVKAARAQLEEIKAGDSQLDSKAVTRLKMILGHIIQDGNPTSMSASNLTASSDEETSHFHPNKMNGLPLGQFRSPLETSSLTDLLLQGMSAIPSTTTHSQFPNKPTREMQREMDGVFDHYQKGKRRRDAGEEQRSDPPPRFHCPWVSCHEQFNSVSELRAHASKHSPVPCPHTGCAASFPHAEEWDRHIQIAHHDLLDPSSGVFIASSK